MPRASCLELLADHLLTHIPQLFGVVIAVSVVSRRRDDTLFQVCRSFVCYVSACSEEQRDKGVYL